MKNKRPSLEIWVLLLIGGLAKGLAYHPFSLNYFLAWFCLIPLLYTLFLCNRRNSFLRGYIFGVVFNLSAFYWIGLNSGTSNVIANLSLFSAVLYLSIFWGVLISFISLFENFYFKLLIFPFSLVLLEWLLNGKRSKEIIPLTEAKSRRLELEATGAIIYWSQRI